MTIKEVTLEIINQGMLLFFRYFKVYHYKSYYISVWQVAMSVCSLFWSFESQQTYESEYEDTFESNVKELMEILHAQNETICSNASHPQYDYCDFIQKRMLDYPDVLV